jgi:hypothetical protein
MAYANGVSYPDFLSMTPNDLYSVFRGRVKSREQSINDNLVVAHALAQLIPVALLDSKNYPNKPPTVELGRSEAKTKEQVIAEILQFAQQQEIEFSKLGGGVRGGS